MPTRAEVLEYQATIDGLSVVAYAQIKALLLSLDTPNPIEFRDALLATYPELMAPFMSAASEVAAQWYATLRREAGLLIPYAPVAAPNASQDHLDAGVRYSLSPLFTSEPSEFIGADILSLLAGFSQRMIADQGRETISSNAVRDPVRTGYQRVPRAGCCAFCGLMASRGAVYRSAESAGSVVGRGVDSSETAGKRGGQGRGVKTRGSQGIGNSYHNHCRCAVVPVIRGADNDYLQYTQQFFQEQYSKTGGLVRNADGNLVTDLKATLASWRQVNGTK